MCHIPNGKGVILSGKGRPVVKYSERHSDLICAKTVEPIDMPFGLLTQVGPRKHMFNRIRQMAPMCPHGRAHLHSEYD